jgi:hypothetical protein
MVVYPEDDRYLIDRDVGADHWELLPPDMP